MKIKRALISVSDKAHLEGFVKVLDQLGVEIISTGGTAKMISSLGVSVVEVSDYTGLPEMMDGRVKTLHPKIHAGLLAVRDNDEHMSQMKEQSIPTIDMVVVNLYPFEETVARPGVTMEDAIENIDIGGPSMLRSAAKNFRSVAVLSSPEQYGSIIDELEATGGEISEATMKGLAESVFARTAQYDGAIANYLSGASAASEDEDDLPDEISIKLNKVRSLRYGENPHQKAAFYAEAASKNSWITEAEQLQGKELSFNNIIDLSSAYEMVKVFEQPAVSIVKHNNPCGAATAETLEQAYLGALDCDRLSAFGGIMGFNRAIGGQMAEVILEEADFVECVIAPDFDAESLKAFSVKKNLRVLKVPISDVSTEKDIKKVPGGALVQDADAGVISESDIKVVTKNKPSTELLDAMMFAWKIVKFVKSNAIVLANGTKTVGIGAGQMSRVDSVIISIRKAADRTKGAVLASDAFFPKADSIEEAHKAGVAAIIQPGGSIRDEEVIAACDKFGIPMVLTGMRHFRH